MFACKVARYIVLVSLILPQMSTLTPSAEAATTVQPYVGLLKHSTAPHFERAYKYGVAVEDRSGRAYIRLAAGELKTGTNPKFYGISSPYWFGRLTSRVLSTAQPFDRLIPSWNAVTPAGTWVQVEARAYRPSDSHWTRYYNLGVWAHGTGTIKRHSVGGQQNADGTVATDTLKLSGGAVYTRLQYRLTLFTTDKTRTPGVRLLSVMTSNSRKEATGLALTSDRQAWGRDLNVPKRSQMVYPNGGEVWCSPTSTSMVLAYWGKTVTVPQAAARTYDYTYQGNGNWPFNTAWASTYGLDGYVTRMGSLTQVEEWISAGVPVVISVAWKQGELTGAPLPSSNGHIIVVRGFDRNGNVIVNDPAAASDAQVRRVYSRSELQKVWRKYSGGTVYLIHPRNLAVPMDKQYGSW